MMAMGFKNALVALLAASAVTVVMADCECGYSTNIGNTKRSTTFTELLEADFARPEAFSKDSEWILPSFNVTKEQTNGHFGLTFRPENIMALGNKGPSAVRSEPDKTEKAEKMQKADKAEKADKKPPVSPAGLELRVSSQIDGDMVSVAEIDSRGADLRYGSYRTSMKLTDVAGTCAAFMWYFNDTQEIDMEFLSKDFNTKNGTFPVNLVVQTPKSSEDGYDAAKAGNFIRTDLPFNPTVGFHEYRFDFLPHEVHFYADGRVLAKILGDVVPDNSGHLVLQHWSNGNDVWSGGPPSKDTAITVRYVKAYYNSTDSARHSNWNKRCTGTPSKAKAICAIPDVAANKSAENFFFSKKKNQTAIKNTTETKGDTNTEAAPRPADREEEGSAGMWGVQMGLMLVWGVTAVAAVLVS